MKKNYFNIATFAFLALTLTACSSEEELNELVPSTDNNTICFNIQTPNLTRASDSYNNNSRPTRFKVTAYQGAANYYGGSIDEMSSADGGYSWTSSKTRFWPENSTSGRNPLTFYAFIDNNNNTFRAGSRAAHSFDMTGAVPMFKDFSVNPDVALQNDLMYAVAKDVSKSSSRKGDVTLNFRHALSQICFTAQNNDPTLSDIEITSIEVGGINGKGTYRFPESSTSTLPSSSESRDALGEWTIDRSAAKQAYILSDLSEKLGAPAASGKGAVRNISNPDYNDGQNARRVNDISKAMYLIPQKVSACTSESANDGAYFKVTINVISAYSNASQSVEVFVPVSVDWKEGCRYVYNLVWEGTTINYNVNVADYEEGFI